MAARKKKKKQKLPFGVGCLAFWMFDAAVLCIGCLAVSGMHYLHNDLIDVPVEVWSNVNRLGAMGYAIAVVYGFLGLPTSIGLICKKLWAYYLYTIFTGFAIGMDGYEAIVGQKPWLWGMIGWHLPDHVVHVTTTSSPGF